ncbi:MAG: FG-GAP-like repeat-containing protein [Bacteroidota bacterium]
MQFPLSMPQEVSKRTCLTFFQCVFNHSLSAAILFVFGIGFGLPGMYAQLFTDQTSQDFSATPTGRHDGSLDWGDFDQDGDLDILATGGTTFAKYTNVYRYNSGSQEFEDFSGASNVLDLSDSDASFGDYDNDGDLDILVSGEDAGGNFHTKIYFYDQNAQIFREDSTASPCLIGVRKGSVAWGDYNNDGLLDALIGGEEESGSLRVRVYQNEGEGVFVNTFTTLGFEDGEVVWGDLNNDNNLEFLLAGAGSSGAIFRAFTYKTALKNFDFVQLNIPNIENASIDLADHNADGYLDIALAGRKGSVRFVEVYTNNADGFFGFNVVDTLPTGIEHGQVRWGDYNNDGLSDLLVSGSSSTGRVTKLYRNSPAGTFIEVTTSLTNMDDRVAVAWGDYDQDNKLDIILSGRTVNPSTYGFKLFRNIESSANATVPPTPTSLSNFPSSPSEGDTVNLTWNVPNGSYPVSVKPGLSYQLVIGTASNGIDVLSGMSDNPGGFRQVARRAIVHENSYALRDLAPGTYFWRVQTVDPDFEGSAFSAQSAFTVSSSGIVHQFEDVTGEQFGGIGPAGLGDASLSWADIDNDGDQDLLLCGNAAGDFGTDIRTRLYRNTGTGFVLIPGAGGLPNIHESEVAWADIDHDGYLDLAMCGRTVASELTEVYINNGNSTFSSAATLGVNLTSGSVDWGDYDQDGDLDLLLTGTGAGSGTTTRIYKNQYFPSGTLSFVEDAAATSNIQDIFNGDAKWGDFDSDGYPDIVLSGKFGSVLHTNLYHNEQNGTFTDVSTFSIPGMELSQVIWADINNDSLLDIVLMGDFDPDPNDVSPLLTFSLQSRSGTTISFGNKPLPNGRAGGSISLADYDEDGFMDLLVTGDSTDTDSAYAEIYKNNGNPNNNQFNFIRDPIASLPLRGVGLGSSAAWADIDNDGKIDLALTGVLAAVNSGEAGKITRLYRNINSATNITPNPPQNLTAAPDGFGVTLFWDLPTAPSGYSAANLDGLTYAVYVKRVGGSPDTLVRSPMSDLTNGYRRIVETGKQGLLRQTRISNLSTGAYEWTVQAIDQDLEGSDFAPRDTFFYDNPSFVDVTDSQFRVDLFDPDFPPSGLRKGRVAFGDFKDGYLDIVATGETNSGGNYESSLYEYAPTAGQEFFTPSTSFSDEIPDIIDGSVEWGDFNRDGRMDLLMAGRLTNPSGRTCRVYLNTVGGFQNNTFKNVLTGGVGVLDGCATAGDYDNDGDLDVLVVGETPFPITTISVNDGEGNFSNSGISNFTPLIDGCADWGDLNNDGFLDFIVAGQNGVGGNDSTLIYINQRDGSFQKLNQTITGVRNSSVAWGDYNSDGFLDFALIGQNNGTRITEIWKNNTNETFTKISGTFEGVQEGSVDWGDFNNDGYKDLLVTGESINGPSVHLYRYDPVNDLFIDDVIASAPLPPLSYSDAAWGDINQDGKLDILMVGGETNSSGSGIIRLFQNIESSPATVPDAPTKLVTEILGYEVRFSWDAPANYANNSPAILPSLSYNLRVGTTPGSLEIYSPHSEGSGLRQIVHEGEVSDTTAFRLYNLEGGKYYWSVQAIDADFEASAFSVIDSFVYIPPAFADISTPALGSPHMGIGDGAIEWGDSDNDGDLDLLMVGQGASSALAILYQNNGDSTFTSVPTSIAPLLHADVSWGDYDNDDLLDLVLLGETAGGQPITRIYHNDGGNTFSDVMGLDSVSNGAAAWGDLDYDGDLDLALIGDKGGNTLISKVFRNDEGSFVDLELGLPGLQDGDVIWLDVNVDGFMDLLLTGTDSNDDPLLHLYLNDGNFGFNLQLDNLVSPKNSSLDVTDVNLDGYPDFVWTGEDGNTVRAVRVYTNNAGDGTFTLNTTLLSEYSIIEGDAKFGDYDDDGRPDLMISGQSSQGRVAAIFRNTDQAGQAVFVKEEISSLPLQPVDHSTIAWGDFDGDGKLDVAMTGEESTGVFSLRLYQNVDSTANVIPPVPGLQQPVFASDTVVLSWTLPTGNDALSYNLYVGTSPGEGDIVGPMADTDDGYRRVARRGNVGQKRTWKLRGLPTGTYFWSVQSVGQDLEGSDFSTEGTFSFTTPSFVHNNINYLDLPGSLPASFSKGDLNWVDYDGDADLDLAVTGDIGDNEPRTVILENINGVLKQDFAASADLEDLLYSSISWTDYNNDGAPDLLLTGEQGDGNGSVGTGTFRTILYRNNGDKTFTPDLVGAGKFPGLTLGASAWADYDNDGDQDVLIMGRDQFGPKTVLYRNVDGVFQVEPYIDLLQLENGAVAWGDFDMDGDADLAINGYAEGGTPVTNVYRNEGIRGGFVRLNATQASIGRAGEGSLDWGDINNDGIMELLVTGESNQSFSIPTTELYEYNANQDRFQLLSTSSALPGVKAGEAGFGDYNDDGYQDILLTGLDGNNNRITQLFRNDQSSGFVEEIATSAAFVDADERGRIAWGDLDNDGKLDVGIIGRVQGGGNPERALILYQNRDETPNRIPVAPDGLTSVSHADSVVLSWNPPAGNNGYTYNVWVGSSPSDLSFLSPLAHLPGPDDGYRKVAAMGNTAAREALRMMALPAGMYYWAVQSIDQDFEGSVFSAIDSFEYVPPHFTHVSSIAFDETEIEGLDLATAAWGDYDADNDLDVLAVGENLSGEATVFLLENLDRKDLRINSSASASIEGVRNGDLSWHDYDRDGDLDVFVVGETETGPSANLYEYTGSSFTQVNKNIRSVVNGKTAWADFDHDGDADLTVMGIDGAGGLVTDLYQQDADGNFKLFPVPLQALGRGDFVWADIDRNGRTDLLMAGTDNNGATQVFLYRNRSLEVLDQESGVLSPDPGFAEGRMDIGDMNNDGYPDLLLIGKDLSGNPMTKIYVNRADSSGMFDELALTTPLLPLMEGDARWGDYNEDGYLDIAVSGKDASGLFFSHIYQSTNEASEFVLDSLAIEYLEPAGNGSGLIWGDYNGDKKLDFLQLGKLKNNQTDKHLNLFRNDEPSRNVIPELPENLTKEVIGDALMLRWESPTSMDTSRIQGYSYNLFLGEIPNGGDVLPTVAEISAENFEGYHRLVRPGEANYANEWLIQGLEEGKTYFWGVQAIDQDFEGSRFVTDSIVFTPPAFDEVTSEVFPGGSPVGFSEGEISMIDYDIDGDLDIITAGETGSNEPSTVLYLNDGGIFALDTVNSELIPDLSLAAFAWGDYNNDGWPDLAVSGRQEDGAFLSRLYAGGEDGLTYDVTASASLEPVAKGSMDWGDYDNDGDQDLALMGLPEAGLGVSNIYRNNGDGTFSRDVAASEAIADVSDGQVAWGDYDQDGDLDLAITGDDGTDGIAHIYRNDKNGAFSLKSILAQVRNSSLDWGDVGNNGFLDLIICGFDTENGQPLTRLYTYDPGDTITAFFPRMTEEFASISQGSIAFGDYDDNGFLDVLLSGSSDGTDRLTKTYFNTGGNFQEDLLTSSALEDVDLGVAVWGDFNGDQKLDMMLAGRTSVSPSISTFAAYRNIDLNPNVSYSAPTQLKHQIFGPKITFSWQPPQGIDGQLESGLTYNLYFGTADNVSSEISPMSVTENEDGYRRLVKIGNAGHKKDMILSGIPNGDYLWSVQVVDQDREGSPFAEPLMFSFENPVPVIVDSSFADQIDDSGTGVESWIELATDTLVADVVLHHRGIADKEWQTQILTGNNLRYTFAITNDQIDEIGAEYFFEVQGIFGFNTVTDTQRTYRYYASGLDVSNLRFGKEISNYNIVSVPLNLDNAAVSNVIEDDFGEYNIYQWRLWRYDAGTTTEYKSGGFGSMGLGEGFWLITKEQRSFNTGAGMAARVHEYDPFIIPLKQGWNQIGNPYPFNIFWSDVIDSNSVEVRMKLGEMVTFSSTGYVRNSVDIDNFGGAFVFTDSALDLRIPVTKNAAIGRRPKPGFTIGETGPIHGSKWQIPLVLESKELIYPLGGIGMHPAADDSKDHLDAITLPRFTEYLELNFHHPEFFAPNFSRDIVSPKEEYVWEFTVESNLGEPDIKLSWENEKVGSGDKQLILFDVEHQKIIDMREHSKYLSFSEYEKRSFRIYYGSEAFIASHLHPDFIHLGLAYPNPSIGDVFIPFSLPPSQNTYQVDIKIFGLDGRLIATVMEGEYQQGFHEVRWNRSGLNHVKASSGMYLYQMQVISPDGEGFSKVGRLVLD